MTNMNNIETEAHQEFLKWFTDFQTEFTFRCEWFYGDIEIADVETRTRLLKEWISQAFIDGYTLGRDTDGTL